MDLENQQLHNILYVTYIGSCTQITTYCSKEIRHTTVQKFLVSLRDLLPYFLQFKHRWVKITLVKFYSPLQKKVKVKSYVALLITSLFLLKDLFLSIQKFHKIQRRKL